MWIDGAGEWDNDRAEVIFIDLRPPALRAKTNLMPAVVLNVVFDLKTASGHATRLLPLSELAVPFEVFYNRARRELRIDPRDLEPLLVAIDDALAKV